MAGETKAMSEEELADLPDLIANGVGLTARGAARLLATLDAERAKVAISARLYEQAREALGDADDSAMPLHDLITELRRDLTTERAETQRLSGIEWTQPDGLTVDSDGRLWRSTPNGKRACTREEVVGVLNAFQTARLAAKGPDAGEGTDGR